jgi:hypothetical protein
MSALLSVMLGLAGAADFSNPASAAKLDADRPFDLTYLSRRAPTVIAVRPDKILKQLGEQKDVAEVVRRFLAASFVFLDGDLKAADPPALADIEQVVVAAQFRVGVESEPDGRSTMGLNGPSAGLVRTAKPFDWSGAVKKWFPKAEIVKHAGREYVRVPNGVGEKKSYLALFVADARTLAFDLEESEMRDLLARLAKKVEAPPPAGWDGVSREMVAVWQDATAEGWLTSPKEPKRATSRALTAAARGMTSVAVGFSAGKDTTLRIIATARDASGAESLGATIKAMLKATPGAESDPAVAKLLTGAAVRCKENEVRVSGSVPGNLLRRVLDPDAGR